MIKRTFDIVSSLLGIILLSPLLFFVVLWIKFDSTGPVFFIQKRVGLRGKTIGVYKFRTMVTDAESKGLKITVGHDPRITKSGHFLRKYKVDELAQLLNVINSSMSLVGPRPEVREYIDVYPDEVREKVLSVKPGITDYASIEFKDENQLLEGASDPNKVYIDEILPIKQKYYLRYVEEQSFIVDIKLIIKTIIVILK
jgi:lipopolysaccharide/colanic/teichoic acid biosynthesis glycosyltransferase|tara:strand:+ start:217 stop:810 length:594 start_codon:yes stop_codon:yes gene_type:complete